MRSMETSTDNEPVDLRPRTFESFYALRRDEVYRVLAVSLRDPALAAEATDEAMTRAFSRWSSIQAGPNPTGWVYRVAFNYAMDHLRRQRRRVRGIDEPAVWEPSTPRPDLTAALSRLSVDHRAVVVLRCIYDWSEAEVAVALGVPLGTVKSRLSRALDRLRQEVTP